MKRADVIDCADIKAGGVIVGLASFGKAVYETEYNSGIASNGLTAARHILLSSKYKKFNESYSPTIADDKVFSGKYSLSDNLPNAGQTIGEALLSPTRTYLPVVKKILEKERNSVRAFIHCTGGGLVKSKNFGKNIAYIKDNLFETPPIFEAIREAGNIPLQEMFQIFNMGHRLEVYCEKDKAENIINISNRFGIDAKIIGRTESAKSGKNEVLINHQGKTYTY
jgi:phosphoribosylformylglycinamidine cyclo-ligase